MINLEPEAYLLEWVAAWNRADVEAVLALMPMTSYL